MKIDKIFQFQRAYCDFITKVYPIPIGKSAYVSKALIIWD